MADLDGKVALITGAKGGLGSAVTNAFLVAGATVAGVSRSISDSDFDHPGFIAVPGELSSFDGAKSAVQNAIAKAGNVHILVHLVGAFAGGTGVHETDEETLNQMMDVNFKSTYYVTKAVLPHMRTHRSGHVIAIGSRAAIEASPNAAAYSASKVAVVALIKAVAAENARYGVSANVVLPGTMDTSANRKAMPNSDFSQWVQTSQVAELIVALASDRLSQVTGAAIPIFGFDL